MAELLVVKCWDEKSGNQNVLSDLLKALDYAGKQNADIIYIGLSFGAISSYDVPSILILTESLRKQGVLIVCPAGNDGGNSLDWPAASPHVISVTSIVEYKASGDYQIADYSNYADKNKAYQDVTFCAFGGDDNNTPFTTTLDFSFASESGTSVSAAITTGLIARKLSEQIVDDVKKEYRESIMQCVSSGEHPSKRAPLYICSPQRKRVKSGVTSLLNEVKQNTDRSMIQKSPNDKYGWGLIKYYATTSSDHKKQKTRKVLKY
ncbi:MAG: S8/S53 family peptidase [Planctomycetes bacterium]|nr:S8/S53 family peptidase [Planctomycetota bacterium]